MEEVMGEAGKRRGREQICDCVRRKGEGRGKRKEGWKRAGLTWGSCTHGKGMGGRNHPNWSHESHPLGSEWHIRGRVGGGKSHSGAQGLTPNRIPQEIPSRYAGYVTSSPMWEVDYCVA